MQRVRPQGVNLGLGTTCRVSPPGLGASELTTLTLILGAAQLTPVGGGLREEGGLRPTGRLPVGDHHPGQCRPPGPLHSIAGGSPLRDRAQAHLQTVGGVTATTYQLSK